MLVTTGDVSALCAAFDWTLVKTEKPAAQSVPTDRLASFSGVLLLALYVASYVQSGFWLTRLLAGWILLELVFYLYQQSRYETVNARLAANIDIERIKKVKQRFLHLRGVFAIEDFLSGWFHGAHISTIRRQNVEDFVAYGFYTQTLQDLSAEARQKVADFVDDVEQVWDIVLPAGRNPDIRFMAHLWEPLRVLHLPLTLHITSELVCILCHWFLRSVGFSSHHCQGLKYWLKAPSLSQVNAAGEPYPPLVFLHGVGMGVLPYLGLLRNIRKACPHTPIVIFDLPAVSLRIGKRAPDVDDISRAAVAVLQHFPSQRAMFAAHSFGTFCVSRICQLHPEAVHSVVLMDPVCMLTCYPQLLANFVYKLPSVQDATSSIVGLTNSVRWLLARDLIIAETFCRKFLWHSLMLWPEDLPARAIIAAARADDLVPADMVARQLHAADSKAILMLHPTAGHGGFLLDGNFQAQLVAHVKDALDWPSA